MPSDSEILNWLETRGRVKSRVFAAPDDNFVWDIRDKAPLRAAVALRMGDDAAMGVPALPPPVLVESRRGRQVWRREQTA
jgi:hypothetical protein